MANTINATALTPIVAGAITSDYQVTIYDQSGNAGRAAVADVVSAANALNSEVGIKTAKLTIATADVLTLNATPIPFGITVPTGYIPMLIGAPVFSATYNSAAYAANTAIRIRSVGGSVDVVSTASALDFTADTIRLLDIQLGADNTLLYLTGADLEVYVPTGDPTTGDSDITIYLTYALIEL
jgi:hypothetical protein